VLLIINHVRGSIRKNCSSERNLLCCHESLRTRYDHGSARESRVHDTWPGTFVEGGDSLREWWMNSEKNSRTVDPRRRLTINEQADQEFGLQGCSRVATSNITTAKLEKESRDVGSAYSVNNDGSTPLPLSSPLRILLNHTLPN
jgi:hypothetical protein